MKTGKRAIACLLAAAAACTAMTAESRAETEAAGDSYVVWGYGRGITENTAGSGQDLYAETDPAPALSPLSAGSEQAENIDSYYRSHGGMQVFGGPVDQGYVTEDGTAFREYEYAEIFTSGHGTYCVSLPMLNVYTAGGGFGSLGAPTGEQYMDGTDIRQDFEAGTLFCKTEKVSGDAERPDTLAVRRDNRYYFRYTLAGGEADLVVAYGKAEDQIYIGDWDGDGMDTLCVRRGNLYYFKNSMTGGEADTVIAYGRPEDEILVGDWDGDGKDTLCVRRGNLYYFKNSISGGEADTVIPYGKAEDEVFAGDWDGDGKDTLCVRRGNQYYIKNRFSGGEADRVVAYGKAGDSVLAGDWDGDGKDTLCVRRGSMYYIKNSISGGEADREFAYGRPEDTVYAGSWTAKERVPKLPEPEAADLQLNQSQGFTYSRLTLGFAGNAVNSTAFRKNAVVSHVDGGGNITQYCAYYDCYGTIVLAERENMGGWEYRWTGLQGDVTDAHNVISIAVDGAGYLHMAWSLHSGKLYYAVADSPGSMNLHQTTMIGSLENGVTYSEFYAQPSGDLFFLYRNGGSGNGNLVLNHYSVSEGVWTRLHDNLISGEGRISPYWQACVDSAGRLHISWVWRETGNVATNYNMSYAVSTDASGTAFVNSRGEPYALPVTESSAETICEIPQGSALINQTSMTTDGSDYPYIISYWRVDGVVQYNILRYTGERWIVYNTDIRTTDFELSGGGTRQLPCARPQILVSGSGDDAEILVFFRDEERDSRASLARLAVQGEEIITEKMIDLTGTPMGEWEPSVDPVLWKETGTVQVFLQYEHYRPDGTEQGREAEYVWIVDVTSFLAD